MTRCDSALPIPISQVSMVMMMGCYGMARRGALFDSELIISKTPFLGQSYVF